MKKKSGFTLVELTVVIAILSLLTVIAAFNYLNVQRQARDKQRAADASIVSNSLEKYFADHGEYPSVSQVTNSNGSTVKQLLGLAGLDALVAPFAPNGTTNSWKSGSADSTNTVTYSGNTDTSSTCNTDTTTSAACTDFKIQYYNEQDGTTTTITSRNKSVAVNVTQREGVVAPNSPTVTIAGTSTATATASVVTCQAGATAQYSFQTQTNNSGTWSGWTAWSSTNTYSLAAAEGSKYDFRAKAQCQVGSVSSADSAISSIATYIRDITTPATPSVYTTASFRPYAVSGNVCVDASGQGGAGTLIQIYTCNGSASQDWAYNSNDKTLRPTYNTTLCVNMNGRGVQLTLATCNGSTSQQWARYDDGTFHSISGGYCMDDSNFGTANGNSIAAWDCNGATAQIWNPSDSQTAWTWPATTCPTGTAVEYQVYNQTTGLADVGWTSTGTTARTVRTTVNQGYTYTTQVRVRCYNSTIKSSAWSGSGQANIQEAVIPPGPAYNWSWGTAAGRASFYFYYTVPTCGAGTTPQMQWDAWIGTNNNANGMSMYWTDKGPGNIYWYALDKNWYTDNASNTASYNNVQFMGASTPYGINVMSSAIHRCMNTVTGRNAVGPTSQSPQYNT